MQDTTTSIGALLLLHLQKNYLILRFTNMCFTAPDYILDAGQAVWGATSKRYQYQNWPITSNPCIRTRRMRRRRTTRIKRMMRVK
jgi:hypothetical protein